MDVLKTVKIVLGLLNREATIWTLKKVSIPDRHLYRAALLDQTTGWHSFAVPRVRVQVRN